MVSGPPRLVSVWCPEWPTVAAGIPPDQPAIVVRANRVIARTPAAAVAGVRAGARRRSAQGACPDALVLEHDLDRDARAFEPVVRAIAEMAPRLEVVEPGWVCLAARGPSRYFGGDAAMAARIVRVVGESAAVPVVVGVGVAEGRTASAIAARRAARTAEGVLVVPAGEASRFIADQSVAWLRELGEVDADMVDLFARLGVTKMGQLAALDRGDVLARFGVEGAHAHRVGGATDDRPAVATDPPPERWVEQTFAEPVEQLDTVVFVAKRLADQLAAELAAEGRVCVRLVVVVETEHGERSERAWYRDRGFAERGVEHDVGGLAADAGQRFERLARARDLAAVLLDEDPAGLDQVLRLRAVQADRLDAGRQSLDAQREHRRRGPRPGEERARR